MMSSGNFSFLCRSMALRFRIRSQLGSLAGPLGRVVVGMAGHGTRNLT